MPDSTLRHYAVSAAEDGPWLPVSGIEFTDAPPSPRTITFKTIGMTPVWVLARMPDGNCAEGTGRTLEEATADAHRTWRHWKRAHAGRLAVDGRDYRRRMKARARRRRR